MPISMSFAVPKGKAAFEKSFGLTRVMRSRAFGPITASIGMAEVMSLIQTAVLALVAIFMVHPRPLSSSMRPAWLAAPFALFFLWWWADLRHIVPGPDQGMRLLVITEMLLAIVLAAVQWRRSRGDALNRASLRWLSLSLLVGSGLFITLIVATTALGWLPPMPQGYAFGFFLFIYIGIALGLRRYRLFELDEWAYRMLLWVGGALVFGACLSATTAQATAFGANNVVLATYQGGTLLDADYGRTVIDGSDIKTGTVTASQLVKTAALITEAAQIGNAVISGAKIGDLEVDTIKLKDGSVSEFNVTGSATTPTNNSIRPRRNNCTALEASRK